jgi:hypothetical protein
MLGSPSLQVSFFEVSLGVLGLTFSIGRSKHWILNKMVFQLLAGLVVKRVLARMLEGQIRRGLEAAAWMLSEVVEVAEGRGGGGGGGRGCV